MCEAVSAFLVGTAATEGAAATSGIIGSAGVLSPMFTVATGAAGLGLSAMGTMQQANAANKQAAVQAQIAANNAQIAENEAAYARGQAEKNAEAQKRKTMQIIGTQRAAMGASGAVVDEGSFMDVSLDTVERGTYDALALLEEGERAAWRAENQAGNFRAQSTLHSASKKSAFLPVAGSLLSGAGQIGMNYYKMKP